VFIAMALFAGRDNLAAIQRYGQFLTQAQRGWLGFGRKQDSLLRKVPSCTALRNLLLQIDPHQLADCFHQWLQANVGTLPRALAIDGKWIRDRALSLCLSDHETGAPVAMGFAKEKIKNDDEQSKDDYKREGEQTVALRLYETTHLQNATVTGDARNNNCNLSALRVCLVALKADLHQEPSWPELQERCQHNPQIPFLALVKHRSK
jgi:hypothetical protein